MARHASWLIAILAVSGIGIPIAFGVEPSGQVLWTLSRERAGTSPESVRVRLQLESVAPLRDAVLRVRTPEGVSVAPVAGASPGQGLALGDLDRGRPLVLVVEFSLPRGTGGTARFTVSGRLADGRPVEESVGWTLAAPRGPPTRRFGAAEYPAVPEPSGRP